MTTSVPPSGQISAVHAVGPADRAGVLTAVEESGLFPPAELGEVEEALDAYLGGTAGPGDRWVTDGAGVAYYAPERMAEGTWNLYLLAVAASAQGSGRGSKLVRHVEADLRATGARVLLIETSGVAGFAAQRRFYRGLGYDEEARIRDFYAAGDDKVIFWKAL